MIIKVGIVVLCAAILMISGCAQEFVAAENDQPVGISSVQQAIDAPPQHKQQREVAPAQKAAPLIPEQFDSMEECVLEWGDVLKEKSDIMWIDSNHIVAAFDEGVSFADAKQVILDHGLEPTVYNMLEAFPKNVWSDYTEEELFELSHSFKIEVDQGTEVVEACKLYDAEGINRATPDVFLDFMSFFSGMPQQK